MHDTSSCYWRGYLLYNEPLGFTQVAFQSFFAAIQTSLQLLNLLHFWVWKQEQIKSKALQEKAEMSWVIQWELTLTPLFRDLLPLALSFKTTTTFNYDVSADRVQSCDLVSRGQDGRNRPLADLGKSWKMDLFLVCGKNIFKGLRIFHLPLGMWNLNSQALSFPSYPPTGGPCSV